MKTNLTYLQRRAKARYRHFFSKENLGWLEFPLVIQVDTNNICGPKHCGVYCTYCFPQWQVVNKQREHRLMPMSWMLWILREIQRDGRNMGFIDWFLNGDALTEPRLHEILDMSKRACPWLRTQTFTCGTLTENVDLILDKNLDSICFTISAHNEELYRKVHRSKRFKDAIKTLEIVLEKRHQNQNVEVHMVLTKDNISYAIEWYDYFGKYEGLTRIISPLVASYDNVPSREALGDLTLDHQEKLLVEIAGVDGRMWTRKHLPPSRPCVLWDNMSIDVSGAILQCCNWSDFREWNYGYVQDFMEDGCTLKDAWMERLANKMRNKLCGSCNMKVKDWKQRLDAIKVEAKIQK